MEFNTMSERKRYGSLLTWFAPIAMSLAIVAASSQSCASDPSRDPGGWRQFKWGMNLEDAEKLVPNAQFQPSFSPAMQGLLTVTNGFTVGQTPVLVTFEFACGGYGLYDVILSAPPEAGASANFIELAEQQYGTEDSVNKSGVQYTWNFPTTLLLVSEHGATYAEKTQALFPDCPAKDNGL